jgi:hypothetical protein
MKTLFGVLHYMHHTDNTAAAAAAIAVIFLISTVVHSLRAHQWQADVFGI